MDARSLFKLSGFAMLLVFCSCDPSQTARDVGMMKYNMAVDSAVTGKGYAGKFNRVFQGSENIISYYDGSVGATRWTSFIGLHSRYVLCMTFPITLDAEWVKVVSESAPEFYLYEISRITLAEREGIDFQFSQLDLGKSFQFWQRIFLVAGDFEAVGIVLVTNNPVANFDPAWRKFK